MTNLTTAEQQAVTNGGLYNGNRYDQSSNPYGYAGSGYLTNFPRSMNDAAIMLNAMDRLVTQADTAATTAAAVVASRPKANSTTSFTIASSGNATFVTAENLITAQPFFVGDFAKVFNDAAPADYIWGEVTAVAANSITVAIASSGGSGTFSAWTVIATGEQGAATGIASVSQDPSPVLGGNFATGAYDITFSAAGSQLIFDAASSGIAANGTPITQAVLGYCSEALTSLGSVSNTVSIDPTTGHKTFTLAGNATLSLPSGLRTGQLIGVQVWAKQGASTLYTLTHDSKVHWVNNVTPTMTQTANATDIYTFLTKDGGANWVASAWQGLIGL